MRLIGAEAHFYGEVPTDYEGALNFIEIAGRICYRSEDKITFYSAEAFVKKLIKSEHLAMIEHSNFVVRKKEADWSYSLGWPGSNYLSARYKKGVPHVGGNLRAWFEAALVEGPNSIYEPFCAIFGKLFGNNLDTGDTGLSNWEVCPPEEIPHALKRFSVLFTCDRGVSHELVRHRPCSFAQESTRYVNYGKKDIEFIRPANYVSLSTDARFVLCESLKRSEESYKTLLVCGCSPQQARAVLPNALATRIVVTADPQEWSWIKHLRTAPGAHPDMIYVMSKVQWDTILNSNRSPG